MEYKDFRLIDFLLDEDFKEWVLNPDSNRTLFWDEWLRAYPEKRQEFMKAKEIILKMRFSEVQEEEDFHEVFGKILQGEKSAAGKFIESQKMQRSGMPAWLKIAASLSLIIVAIYFFRVSRIGQEENNITVSEIVKNNPKGRKLTFALPDGSIVNLNSESSLFFPETFHPDRREVRLVGEAYFDIKGDSAWPFVVIAGNISTTALGTSFNVRAWPDKTTTDIALVSGIVEVKKINDANPGMLLSPGEKITHDEITDEFTKSKFDLALETGWKDKILVFKNASLGEFVQTVERWYDVEIELQGASPSSTAWSIDGEFRDTSLEQVLESLSFVYKINYAINGRKVILKF